MLAPFAMFTNTCNVYQIKAGTLLLVREQEVESVISRPWMLKRLLRAKICNGHLWKGCILISDHRTEIIARKVKGLYIPQSPPPFVAQAGEGRDKGWDGDQARWAHLAKKISQKIKLSIKRPKNKLQKLEDALVEQMYTSASSSITNSYTGLPPKSVSRHDLISLRKRKTEA